MKKSWIIIIIVLLSASIIGGYIVFDNIFPKARPIQYPAKENIISISINQNDGASIVLETEESDKFLEYIEDGQSTRKMSVNDFPTVKTYYEIIIDTTARKYQYFVYIEDSYVYIEMPYEGIYKSSRQLFDFVEEQINN